MSHAQLIISCRLKHIVDRYFRRQHCAVYENFECILGVSGINCLVGVKRVIGFMKGGGGGYDGCLFFISLV